MADAQRRTCDPIARRDGEIGGHGLSQLASGRVEGMIGGHGSAILSGIQEVRDETGLPCAFAWRT